MPNAGVQLRSSGLNPRLCHTDLNQISSSCPGFGYPTKVLVVLPACRNRLAQEGDIIHQQGLAALCEEECDEMAGTGNCDAAVAGHAATIRRGWLTGSKRRRSVSDLSAGQVSVGFNHPTRWISCCFILSPHARRTEPGQHPFLDLIPRLTVGVEFCVAAVAQTSGVQYRPIDCT